MGQTRQEKNCFVVILMLQLSYRNGILQNIWLYASFCWNRPMAKKRDEDREIALAALTADREFQCRAMPSDVDKLAASIARDGQLSAVLVRPVGGNRFQLIAGFTRVRALRKLGRTHVRARILHDLSDAEARRISLAENLERQDLTAWDQVFTAARYRQQGLSNAEIAGAFGGVAIRTIQRYLRVAEAPEEFRHALARDEVTVNQVYEAIKRGVSLSELTGRGRSVRYLRGLSRKREAKSGVRIQRRKGGEIIINARFEPDSMDFDSLLKEIREKVEGLGPFRRH
jgi:ParB/RepB/Spo0J family partition protein